MTCLQLRDKLLDVGGDDLFGGLPLLRLFGVWGGRGDVAGGGDGVHGCFLLGLGRCFSCHAWHVPTCRTPPGEGGGSKAQGEGYLPPVGRENRVIFREKLWGHPLRRAWGRAPSVFACSWRWGVAGRVDLPAEVGGGGPKGRRQGGNVLPLGVHGDFHLLFAYNDNALVQESFIAPVTGFMRGISLICNVRIRVSLCTKIATSTALFSITDEYAKTISPPRVTLFRAGGLRAPAERHSRFSDDTR